MRKILTIGVISLILTLVACGPSKEQAIKHNDLIVEDQKAIIELEEILINAIIDWNYLESVKALENANKKTKELIVKYEDIEAFDKGDEFKISFVELLKAFESVVEKEYSDALFYLIKFESMDDMDDDSFVALMDLLDEIDIKVGKANDNFLSAQKVFAERYKLQLK